MSDRAGSERAALGGTAVLMACACGAATESTKLVGLAGLGATNKVVHPIFIALAAGLIVRGLWRTARPSAYLAIAAFVVLAAGAVLTPPMVMTMSPKTPAGGVPWTALQMAGASLYVLAAGLLGYAFWRAFPTPQPGASATAIGGMTLATGCTCCMVTGAVAGMAVTAGASTAFESTPIIFWTGLAIVAGGLYRLGGLRAAALVPVGGLVIRYGPELLKLTGDWMAAGVNFRFLPSYLTTVAGAGIILYGFAVAFSAARSPADVAHAGRRSHEPTLEGAGAD